MPWSLDDIPDHLLEDADNADAVAQLRNTGAGVTTGSTLEDKFAALWAEYSTYELVREHKFHPFRKWRFDFAHLASRTAIELEGGVYANGRHTRGAGYTEDCRKYNEAIIHGWAVFRLTSEMLTPVWIDSIIDCISERMDDTDA